MFCCQCERESGGTRCGRSGTAGEAPETPALQDLLIYVLKDMARFHYRGRDREGANPNAPKLKPFGTPGNGFPRTPA
ncbi:MAG: hypothetical protein HN849_01430 [Victivallales bacterium]|nr:hypothetical protein [Victivallales bacterium]MBT7298139.1 hypothetical protein [Victivallales bacterium]